MAVSRAASKIRRAFMADRDDPSHGSDGEPAHRDPRSPHPPMDPGRREELGRRIRRYALIVGTLAAALAAWGIVSRLATRSELRKSSLQDAVATVVTAKPQLSGAGDELVLPGIVQAYIESPIYARTSGYLKSWRTDIGAKVHKGDLLAEIDTPEVDKQFARPTPRPRRRPWIRPSKMSRDSMTSSRSSG